MAIKRGGGDRDGVIGLDRTMERAQSELVDGLSRHLARIQQTSGNVLIVGICGAQGSGKSTLASALSDCMARRYGLPSVCLSLDDFYLTQSARMDLGRSVHPLCAVRGVPGTHDVGWALKTLSRLKTAGEGSQTPIPRFDKLSDDRSPDPDMYQGRPSIIFFEGWCVGAAPQTDDALNAPVNDLERRADAEGVWRRWSNTHLAGAYATLWDEIDHLIFIQVPDLDFVIDARWQQEQGLGTHNAATQKMTREEIAHFVAHYERLTRHIWATMSDQADTVLSRDASGFHDLRLSEN